MDKEQLFTQILGKSIRQKRMEKGLTIEQLADRAEIDPDHLGRLERGEKSPRAFTLGKIQLVLNLNSDVFLQEFVRKLELSPSFYSDKS